MYRIPFGPYYLNAQNYYANKIAEDGEDSIALFWIWLREEYGAEATTVKKSFNNKNKNVSEWIFKTEQQRDWFILRWS